MKNLKGKSLCMFSSKGGSGKTTTALNLAGVFSSLNKKVLIIDFDLTSGGIAIYLNKPFEKTIYNFVDDYANNRYKNITNYVTKYNDNIDILPTVKDPRQGSKIDSSYAEIVIEKSIYEYDIVLIDMTHDLSELNISILDNVDSILCNLTNDLIDLKNARNLVKIFNDAGFKNYKFILNEYINPNKKYYSLYDIKSIIKANIDYLIPGNFYLKSIDNYVADGKILTLESKMPKIYPKVYKSYLAVCNDLMEAENEK